MATNHGRDPHDPAYFEFVRNSKLRPADFRSPFEISPLAVVIVLALLVIVVGSVAAMGVCTTTGCW